MVCGNFILPEPASYVFFYAIFNLRKLFYLIEVLTADPKPFSQLILGIALPKKGFVLAEKSGHIRYAVN